MLNDHRQHVYRDLHPYCCTFEDCATAERLYDSRHAWFKHELEAHRATWQCVEGCDKSFATEKEFVIHVTKNHPELVSENILSVLKRTAVKGATLTSSSECPLCQKRMTLRALHKHLGNHQEELALFALPSNVDATEDEEVDSDFTQDYGEEKQSLSSDISENESQDEDAAIGDRAGPEPPESAIVEIKCVCTYSTIPLYTVLAVPTVHIKCKDCETWQHRVCYYRGEDMIPLEGHKCVDCDPRPLSETPRVLLDPTRLLPQRLHDLSLGRVGCLKCDGTFMNIEDFSLHDCVLDHHRFPEPALDPETESTQDPAPPQPALDSRTEWSEDSNPPQPATDSPKADTNQQPEPSARNLLDAYRSPPNWYPIERRDLRRLVANCGTDFPKISGVLGSKSPNQVENEYRRLVEEENDLELEWMAQVADATRKEIEDAGLARSRAGRLERDAPPTSMLRLELERIAQAADPRRKETEDAGLSRPRAGSPERDAPPTSMLQDGLQSSDGERGPPPSTRGFDKINSDVGRDTSVLDPQSKTLPERGRTSLAGSEDESRYVMGKL